MDKKQKANSIKLGLLLLVIIYTFSILDKFSFIIKNYSNLTLDVLLYLTPFLILGIYILYRFIKIIISYSKKTDTKINSDFKEMREKNLEFTANMPTNAFEYFKYNMNKSNSTEFLFFGNGKLNLFFLILFTGFLIYNSKSNQDILMNLGIISFALLITIPIILFMTKITSKNQLKFDKELEEKKEMGIKPGIMDELTWKSLLIIFLIAPILVGLIMITFAIILYFFA